MVFAVPPSSSVAAPLSFLQLFAIPADIHREKADKKARRCLLFGEPASRCGLLAVMVFASCPHRQNAKAKTHASNQLQAGLPAALILRAFPGSPLLHSQRLAHGRTATRSAVAPLIAAAFQPHDENPPRTENRRHTERIIAGLGK